MPDLNRFVPTDVTDRITEVDFAGWSQNHDINAVLLDIEGTISPHGKPEVPEDIQRLFREARAAGFIEVIGLVTNKKDSDFSETVARQVGADGYFYPRDKSERKPSPALIEQALSEFDLARGTTGYVGDKLTADVAAANAAGLRRVAWVHRLGRSDFALDRVRRLYEDVLWYSYVHRRVRKANLKPTSEA